MWRTSFLIALLVTAAPQAWAKNQIDSLERIAKKACAAGDFRKGVNILADLYVRTDDPTFVFNQGRCYQENHEWKSAIDRFREFQRKTEGKVEEQADAEKHITECKRRLDEEAASAASSSPPPPPPKEPSPVAVPPAAVTPPPAVAEVRTAVTEESHAGSALRATGIVVGGVGLAALAGALALNLKANSLADKANRDHDPAAESSQKSYKTGAIVCYGVGGVALITGTILYLIGHSKKTSRALAFAPILSPGEAGLALSGEF